jgi:hypothetical protein
LLLLLMLMRPHTPQLEAADLGGALLRLQEEHAALRDAHVLLLQVRCVPCIGRVGERRRKEPG